MADNGFKINKSVNLNPQAGAPTNPINGDFYYDSSIGSFAYYHDGSWANFDSVGSVTSVLWMTGALFTPDIVRNSVIKVTGAAALSHLAGISSSFSAKRISVYNAGAYTIVVEPEDGAEATANNRILTPTGGSMNLVAGEMAVFTYDVVATRWLLVSISSNAGAQVIATTSNPGLVTLHATSLLPMDGVVLSDGDLNAANGVVGLDADKAATIAPTSAVTGLTVNAYEDANAATFNGAVTISIDPVLDQNAATKHYVDEHHALHLWQEQIVPAGITTEILDVAWGATPKRWVAVGPTGAVLVSNDGIYWFGTNAPAGQWNGIVYGSGQFVAVGSTTANRVMTSPDGITWTLRTASSARLWNRISWNGSVYVAIAQDATAGIKVMTSSDGITWTDRTSPSAISTYSWKGICWTGTLFVVCGADLTGSFNGILMTSLDGITWTERTVPATTGALAGVAWNGTLVTSVGGVVTTGALRIITSTTGASAWSTVTLPDYFVGVSTPSSGTGIAGGHDYFAATLNVTGWDNYGIIVSKDGINWHLRRTPHPSAQWKAIAFGGVTNQFAAVGLEGSTPCLMSSGVAS